MKRELEVFIDKQQVGKLTESAGLWSFHYDAAWVRSGYPLAPSLPLQTAIFQDGGTTRPVQWFFDNLLPEENARSQLYASLPQGKGDAWDLLAHFGAESAGALTLLPPGQQQDDGGLNPLSHEDLEIRIQAIPRQALAAKAPKKMSLAGAQQKLPIVLGADGTLFEPVGIRASTHILKPDAANEHYPNSAVNEWFCARLAQRLGLDVPSVEIRFVPSPVYIIQRFDRVFSNTPPARKHILDAAQLLNLAAGFKYAKSGVEALIDIIKHCREKLPTRIALFRWTLFNILIGNSDAHLKNISLFAGAAGYSLAPHYDLLSTVSWSTPELLGPHAQTWPDVPMSFPIAGAITYPEVRVQHLHAFAKELGVPSSSMKREHLRLVGGICKAADEVITEFAERTDVPLTKRAGCMKMLRSIRYMPIAEIASQLR